MRTVARYSTRFVERYLPDAYIFLVCLTLIVLLLGMLHGSTPREVITYWGEGYFDILLFTMKSTLMLTLGYALANTPTIHRGLRALARLPRNEVQVIVSITIIMMAASWISWAFGLVAGGIVAREMGAVHGDRIHYPLVVASAYAGFLVWHAGYGGSVPQLIATPDHFLADRIGVIPVTETIFAPSTYVILLALAIVIPVVMVLMRPAPRERIGFPSTDTAGSSPAEASPAGGNPISLATSDNPESTAVTENPAPARTHASTDESPAARLEQSRVIMLIFAVLGFLYLVSYFAEQGIASLNLDIVVYTFLVAGLFLTPNLRQYIGQIKDGARTCWGIILQFPFYGALMGVMTNTGIAQTMADFFAGISSAATLPFWSFISAGIVNVFVPSGGGQWIVQGPVMVEAAQGLNADIAHTAMGVAWGDAWTNMIQPFWALPLLSIAGLGIRDIMGYTAIVLVISGVIIGGGLLIL